MIYKESDADLIALEMMHIAEEDLGRELSDLEKIAFIGAAINLAKGALKPLGSKIMGSKLVNYLKGNPKFMENAGKVGNFAKTQVGEVKDWGKNISYGYNLSKQMGNNFKTNIGAGLSQGMHQNPYLTAGALTGTGAMIGATGMNIANKAQADKQDTYNGIKDRYASFDSFLDECIEKEAARDDKNKWLAPAIGTGAAIGAGLLLRKNILKNKALDEQFMAAHPTMMRDMHNSVARDTFELKEEAAKAFNNMFPQGIMGQKQKKIVEQFKSHIDSEARDLPREFHGQARKLREKQIDTWEVSDEIKNHLKNHVALRFR